MPLNSSSPTLQEICLDYIVERMETVKETLLALKQEPEILYEIIMKQSERQAVESAIQGTLSSEAQTRCNCLKKGLCCDRFTSFYDFLVIGLVFAATLAVDCCGCLLLTDLTSRLSTLLNRISEGEVKKVQQAKEAQEQE